AEVLSGSTFQMDLAKIYLLSGNYDNNLPIIIDIESIWKTFSSCSRLLSSNIPSFRIEERSPR
ncbi:hypothetical protein N9J38_01300, partial [bacterium]|nr:hypothetical protein [bacterium]